MDAPAPPQQCFCRDCTDILQVHFSDDISIIPNDAESQTIVDNPHKGEGLWLRWPGYARRMANRRSLPPVDNTVYLLALLCCPLIVFMIGTIAWARHNPPDLCTKVPALAKFFNHLPAALLTVLPGLGIGLIWTFFHRERNGPMYDCEGHWGGARIFWTTVLVALITVVVMPCALDVRVLGGEVHCAAC